MVVFVAALILSPTALNRAQLTGPQIIKKMNAAVRAGSPVTGMMETTGPRGQSATFTFQIMYPRLFSGKISFMNFQNEVHWTKDAFYLYQAGTNEYFKIPQPPNMGMDNMGLYGLDSLFSDKENYTAANKVTKTTFNGHAAYAVAITSPSFAENVARGDTLFVDATSFLPLGFDEDDPSAGGIEHEVYKNMKWRAKLTKKDFAWTPPKGAKLVKMPGR